MEYFENEDPGDVGERPRIHIVGLSGKAGSGKDFIATNAFSELGYYQWSFAWHLKVGVVGKGLASYEDVFFNKPPEVRKILQIEGTEEGWMKWGQRLWVDSLLAWTRIASEYFGINKFVVPDVRFTHEVEGLHEVGGRVYRIVAPTRTDNNGLSAEARNHISETALDHFTGFDGFIYNEPGTTQSDLYHQVASMERRFIC